MNAPLRILAVSPQPSDTPWSPVAAASSASLKGLLAPMIEAGRVELVTPVPATANALEEQLQENTFDILHVIAHGTSRIAARYGTVTLEGSDRRARDLNAQNFARLCAAADGLMAVVLQGLPAVEGDLSVTRDTVAAQAAALIYLAASVAESRAETFLRAFYSAAASGESIDAAFKLGNGNPSGLPAQSASDPQLIVRTRPAATPSRRRAIEPATQPLAAGFGGPTPTAPVQPPADDREAAVSRELERKRLACAFDVFLCHNVGDKPAVMEIGRRLMSRGVLPWLDLWELRPGMPWQRLLEEQIARITAAAVFVGHDGIGPWQRQELDGFLREFNKRGCPVIPVMLPGAGGEPELPLFLRGMTWVDFRLSDPDPLDQLIWGVTGQRPSVR